MLRLPLNKIAKPPTMMLSVKSWHNYRVDLFAIEIIQITEMTVVTFFDKWQDKKVVLSGDLLD